MILTRQGTLSGADQSLVKVVEAMQHREEPGHYPLGSVEPGEVVGVGLLFIALGLIYDKVMVGAKDKSNTMSKPGEGILKIRPKRYDQVVLNVSLFRNSEFPGEYLKAILTETTEARFSLSSSYWSISLHRMNPVIPKPSCTWRKRRIVLGRFGQYTPSKA